MEDINIISATIPVIKQALIRGAIRREPVRTVEFQRGIGKTTALIKFAQEHGLVVIMPHTQIAKRLREEHNYEGIIGQCDIGRQPIDTKFVYDEGVDISSLKGVRHVITGFYKL